VNGAYLANIMYQVSPVNSIHVQQSYWSYVDLCGPMQTLTHGGAKHFVIFIDDYS